MKVFALILLFVAAASARSTGTKAVARAELGENPWLVHLRLAITTSGFLETCAGSLIDARWVLTTGGCVANARFVWVRYGVIDVIRPSLVTETSTVWAHPSYDAATGANDIGLVSLNRDVLFPENANIAPVALASAGADLPESATFCAFGENDGTPGDILSCISVEVSAEDNVISAQSEDGEATRFDLGAPLVKDGVQYGVLVRPADGENAGVFLNPADYTDWILGDANIQLNTAEVDAGRRVNFVSA